MNAINSVIVEGNVVRVPELREVAGGSRVCKIPIAVNRSYKNAAGEKVEEVSYFDISAWGNLAVNCAKYCPKGRGVRVVGRLKQDRWKGDDGKSRSHVSIVAEHVEFKPFFKKIFEPSARPAPSPDEMAERLDAEEAARAARLEQEAALEVTF